MEKTGRISVIIAILIQNNYIIIYIYIMSLQPTKPSGRQTKPSGRPTKSSGRSTNPSGRSTNPSGRSTNLRKLNYRRKPTHISISSVERNKNALYIKLKNESILNYNKIIYNKQILDKLIQNIESQYNEINNRYIKQSNLYIPDDIENLKELKDTFYNLNTYINSKYPSKIIEGYNKLNIFKKILLSGDCLDRKEFNIYIVKLRTLNLNISDVGSSVLYNTTIHNYNLEQLKIVIRYYNNIYTELGNNVDNIKEFYYIIGKRINNNTHNYKNKFSTLKEYKDNLNSEKKALNQHAKLAKSYIENLKYARNIKDIKNVNNIENILPPHLKLYIYNIKFNKIYECISKLCQEYSQGLIEHISSIKSKLNTTHKGAIARKMRGNKTKRNTPYVTDPELQKALNTLKQTNTNIIVPKNTLGFLPPIHSQTNGVNKSSVAKRFHKATRQSRKPTTR
jgi:hypothetical protein